MKQRTEPFIITLGMGILIKGICQQLTDAHPLSCKNVSFMKIANGKIGGQIPVLIIIMIVLLVIFFLILQFTSYGRNCYAIGGNYEVGKNSGINVVSIKWSALVVIGGTSFAGGIGGIFESFIGIFVLQLMSNCMDCLNIDAYVQQLLQGILIVLIIGFDCFGRKIKRERV